MATTSRTSGTTNGLIKMSSDKLLPLISTLNLSESTPESLGTKHLYDTAGIVHESQLYNLFGDKELSYVFPHNPIILKKFMRKKGQSLYLGGFIRLEIQEGECEIFLYCSKKLPTFECKTARLEIAEKKIANSVLYPPILTARTTSFPPLILSGIFKNQNDNEQTIFISGTGWFTLQGNCEFSIYSPNGLGIHQLKGCFIKPKEVIHKLPTPDLIE
jgi:ribosome biogenesis GTPase A